MELYRSTSISVSRLIAENYSTSFSAGMRLLNRAEREAIYAVYGFVRIADEIVDTFHDFEKETLLREFIDDTHRAIERGVSANPVLHAYQWAVNSYGIDRDLTDSFFASMEMDLSNSRHHDESYRAYIYGSAEVVGLMCLSVFYHNKKEEYESLRYPARKLGEAFQKVNFLRDMRADSDERGRVYFPDVDIEVFDETVKKRIEADIEHDFREALPGIRKLRRDVGLGVYLAYRYYYELFRKIESIRAGKLLGHRTRLSNARKVVLMIKAIIRYRLRIF